MATAGFKGLRLITIDATPGQLIDQPVQMAQA